MPVTPFRFHWKDDPRKSEEWYAAECLRIGDPRMIAQELDISHSASAVGLEFPPEFFGDHIWFNDWPQDIVCRTMSLDPSRGNGDRTSDYSVWALLAVDRQAHLWFDADASNSRPTEPLLDNPGMHSMVGDGLELFKTFKPHAVLIESNGFSIEVARACYRAWSGKGIAAPPIYIVENREPKPVRIRGLTPFLAQKRMHIRNTPGGRILAQQTREYSADAGCGAAHDDGPDAAAMAISMANALLYSDQTANIHVLRV